MTTLIGQSIPRVDAGGKVTGATEYPGDINMPGMLHMKILFANRPHAKILRVDTAKAAAIPGVVAIYTALTIEDCMTAFP